MKPTILGKLWIYMIILVVVVLVIIWFFQIFFLNNYYSLQQLANMEEELHRIITEIESSGNISSEALAELSNKYNIRLSVLDQYFETIYQDNYGLKKKPWNKDMFVTLRLGKMFKKADIHPISGAKSYIIAKPILTKSQISGAIVVSYFPPQVDEATAILKDQFKLIIFISLIIASLLAFLLSRSFTKPISKMTAVTDKIARGNFDLIFEVKTKNELGQFAKSINHMSEKLAEIDQSRREFVANVSHELKTPLGVIKGYTEALLDFQEPEAQERFLKIIVDETDRMDVIVRELLELSRLQEKNQQRELFKADLVELLQNSIKHQSYLFIDKNLMIQAAELPNQAIVTIDVSGIQKVFDNLINNALIHGSGFVKISLKQISRQYILTVYNTGEPIPKTDLPHIFDRFYKVEKSRKRIAGTGIGLSIVKAILEQHGFKYSLLSDENGTEFQICFPISS